MKHRFASAISGAVAAFSLAAIAVEVPLFEKGNALCEIVLTAKPAPKERAAAELLRDSFRKIGGVDVPIVSAPSGAAAALHVGGTDEGRKAAAKLPAGADRDSFAIMPLGGGSLALAGKSPSGTFYAACEFLERYAGALWAWPGDVGTVMPKTRTLRPDVREQVEVPAFGMRKLSGVPDDWCGYLRMQNQKMEECRGQYSHNCRKVIPWSMWEKHPEYFNLHKGVRVKPQRMKNQLCISNPDVRRIFVEAAKTMLRRWPQLLSFSVAQNDGGKEYFCECDKCRALDVPGVDGMSDRYFDFANAVADGIRDEFPDRAIATLAYGDATCDPPVRTKLRDNVIPCVVVPSMKDPFKGVEAWASSARRIYAYFHLHGKQAPKLYAHKFAEYLRFLKGHKTIGICGELHPATPKLGGSWEIDGPRAWIVGKLMWNPDADVDALFDLFCRRFYGPAAAPMRKFLDRLEAAWNRQRNPYDFRVDYDSDEKGYGLYSEGDIDFLEQCLAEAKKLAAADAAVDARIDALESKFAPFAAKARDFKYWSVHPDGGVDRGENLLKNPGFELVKRKLEAAADLPPDQQPFKAIAWNKWIGAFQPGDVDVDETGGVGGGRCLVFRGTPKAAAGQSVALQPGRRYRFSALARGPVGREGSINVHFRGANGKWLHKSTFVEKAAKVEDPEKWMRLSFTFAVPPEAASAVVHCSANGLAPEETLRYDETELFLFERAK